MKFSSICRLDAWPGSSRRTQISAAATMGLAIFRSPSALVIACALYVIAPLASAATALAQTKAASVQALPQFYSLKSNPVNLRKGPGLQFPKAWIYRREGLPVEVLREHERWRQVRDSEGETGWILRTLISQRRTALVAPWILKERKRRNMAPTRDEAHASSLLPLRSGPRERASTVAQLEAGTLVSLKTCDGAWCQVSIGRFSGYVAQDQLWGVYPKEILR